MGMGYAPTVTQTIKFEGLQAICPVEACAFYEAVKKHETDFDTVARALAIEGEAADYGIGEYSDSGEEPSEEQLEIAKKEIDDALDNLCAAFAEKTKVGNSSLGLELCYHNQESDGDRYDNIDGHYWDVDGVYQFSPAGQKFKDYIETEGFVSFG